MMKETVLVQKVGDVSKGTGNVMECVQELKSLSQTYVQCIMKSMLQNQQNEAEEMLKSHRRLRKAITNLEKTEKESFAYECGIFTGVYRVLEKTNQERQEQEECRRRLAPLERKHTDAILNYLYQNPDARHGRMAEEIGISTSHLSEILNILLKTGYVSRYGEHKNTRYILTKAGRKACKKTSNTWEKREDELIDIDFMEVIDKDSFIRERLRESEGYGESEEEEYAKWARYFGTVAETAKY